MPFLSWRDDYRVGVAHIDQEHRYLFDLINQFHDSHRGGADRKTLEGILTRLVQYAEAHFRHEEQTMLENEYPQHAEHCSLHEELYLAVFQLSEELAANSVRVTMDTHRFLRNWLVKHILKHDLAFSEYLKKRATSRRPDEGNATGNSRAESAAAS